MKRISTTRKGAISDINVTPLVDVTLVLLIIYMLVAPMIELGINVNLPQAAARKMDIPRSITLTISKDGGLFLDSRKVSIAEMERTLRQFAAANPDIGIIVKADKEVRYGKLIAILDKVREAGLTHLGMATRAPVKLKS